MGFRHFEFRNKDLKIEKSQTVLIFFYLTDTNITYYINFPYKIIGLKICFNKVKQVLPVLIYQFCKIFNSATKHSVPSCVLLDLVVYLTCTCAMYLQYLLYNRVCNPVMYTKNTSLMSMNEFSR